MKNLFYLLACILLVGQLHAQSAMDTYVQLAIERNPQLKEKQAEEKRKEAAYKHASRFFIPEVQFLTTYTVAAGGRAVNLPLGTLLNGVYAKLNQLEGMPIFPIIEDQQFNFLPNNFYDARFRITQPIIRPEIRLNKAIKSEETGIARLQTNQVQRDIKRDVKLAYIQWLQAGEVIKIYDRAIVLLTENKRIAESLVKNGVAIPSSVIRIDADLNQVEAKRNKALTDQANAVTYLNLLVDQPPQTPVTADSLPDIPDLPSNLSIDNKEEIMMLDNAIRIQSLAQQIEKKTLSPKLSLQVDLGSQNHVPDWGGYVLGGLQLDVPIYDGGKAKWKQEEWKAAIESTQAQSEWAKKAYSTQLATEIASLQADIKTYNEYSSLVKSNDRYYQETLKRYKEGLIGYIELLDARSQITQSQLEQNLAKYQAWTRRVNIERITSDNL